MPQALPSRLFAFPGTPSVPDDNPAPATERLSTRGTDATVVQLQDITSACWLVMMRPSGAPEAQTDAHTLRGTAAVISAAAPLSVSARWIYVRHLSQRAPSPTGAQQRYRPTSASVSHPSSLATPKKKARTVVPEGLWSRLRLTSSHISSAKEPQTRGICLQKQYSMNRAQATPSAAILQAISSVRWKERCTNPRARSARPKRHGTEPHVTSLAPPRVATCVSAAL